MLAVPDFVFDAAWIATRLGIATEQARTALRDLRRLRLIARRGNRWTKARTEPKLQPEAKGRQHAEMLALARQVLARPSTDPGYFGSLTLAVNPARLPAACERLVAFRAELIRFLQIGNRTTVYHFSTELFRLDSNSPRC